MSEPAFPVNGAHNTLLHHGLSKRELFAAMAMQGFAADPQFGSSREDMAKSAVGWADALIEELGKTPLIAALGNTPDEVPA